MRDPKGRKVVKFPVKRRKARFAVHNSERSSSPCFGLEDFPDLFISFRNPKESMSRLGNVYSVPEGMNGDTALCGRKENWNIEEIEVYTIK